MELTKMEFDVDCGGGVSWRCCKVGTSPTKFLTATKQKNTLKTWLQKVCTHTQSDRQLSSKKKISVLPSMFVHRRRNLQKRSTLEILLLVCCTIAHTYLQERVHSTFAKKCCKLCS
jgi:hypothetical protein